MSWSELWKPSPLTGLHPSGLHHQQKHHFAGVSQSRSAKQAASQSRWWHLLHSHHCCPAAEHYINCQYESVLLFILARVFVCVVVCVCACVCVRCASDQLCSWREGAALLTDPFKGNMVDGASRESRTGNNWNFPEAPQLQRLRFPTELLSSFTWGENIDLWPRAHIQRTVSVPLCVLSNSFYVVVRPNVHRGVGVGVFLGRCQVHVCLDRTGTVSVSTLQTNSVCYCYVALAFSHSIRQRVSTVVNLKWGQMFKFV